MKRPGYHPLLHGLLLFAAGAVNAGEPAAPPLPVWQTLEYEQRAFMVTARSRIELGATADDPLTWRLQAHSSVASNAEEVELTLRAADGQALRRERFSQGKDQRYKTYDYLPQMVVRERFDPPKNTSLPPAQWPLSSRREIPYPPLPAGTVVTDAYALLELAGRFLDAEAASAEVVVNTEFNFYLVKMSRSTGPAIEVEYRLASGETASGRRDTRGVSLEISPLAEPDKPDFSLLGLHGAITILFAGDQALPLQLRGTAPRLGSAEINLRAATLRPDAPGNPGPGRASAAEQGK
ncbi:MAG: hypothetical protein H6988_06620 [Pseudomonadales bacterium]|nr:hypothetical protein [Pseudomonadales bacterium]MCP5190053.1 hypothetical protein [Pseudomonadales bacterium]